MNSVLYLAMITIMSDKINQIRMRRNSCGDIIVVPTSFLLRYNISKYTEEKIIE